MLPDFRVRQRDYLLEISRTITQELDLDKVLERILNISIEMLAGQAGIIALQKLSGGWNVRVSHGLPPAFLKFIESLLSQLPDIGRANFNEVDIAEINHRLQELTYTASMGYYTSVALPMISRGSMVGVIFIFRNYSGTFSANDHVILASFANQAAIAVQNAQYFAQVTQEKLRLDALLDTAGDGILILTNNHIIERCNQALARLLGSPAEVLQGKHHDAVLAWNQPPQGLTLEQAVAGGWPLTAHAQLYIEGDLKRGPGQPPLPVGITYAPLLSGEGTLLNIIATVRDITRFRQADEMKSTFMSIISHELKTPVALIKGYVSTLRRDDAEWDREIVADSLQVIEEEADRLTLMIENLLDATRLQAGGLTIKRSDVSLPALAERLSKRFQTQTTRHTLVVDFPPDFPVILADENRLEQVMSNLISNAMKYAAEGEIRIGGHVLPELVVVCVSDQGPGIAPGDIPFVFDRFYRAPDMARHTKGAGLGLFLTRAIIEAHGGRIWVDPESGKGARICFSLPRPETHLVATKSA